VLEAFEILRRSFPDLLLVLAPRHLERVEEVLKLTRGAWDAALWSSLDLGEHAAHDIVVIDTLGELASIYGIASIAFVGGSLKPFGGHSPLEPAVAGVPVLVGPHTHHFTEAVRELLAAGGARRVTDAVDLSAAASAWLAEAGPRDRAGAAARQTIRSHVGALQRTFDAIAPIIDRSVD
jgi:3-deoxy-D-manno-octulosonic-acid transferase